MKTRDARHAKSRDKPANVHKLKVPDKETRRQKKLADRKRRQELLMEVHRVLRDLLISQTEMRRSMVTGQAALDEVRKQGEKNRTQLLLMSRLVARSVYDVRNGELTPLTPVDGKELKAMLQEAAREPGIRDT